VDRSERIIQRISIAGDSVRAGAYDVGKSSFLNDTITVSAIMLDDYTQECFGKMRYDIYVIKKNDPNTQLLWKSLIDVPLIIEYKID
jgi:hypothetical protein